MKRFIKNQIISQLTNDKLIWRYTPMKYLITCFVLFALVQNIVFAQQTRTELVDRRSFKSKTFKNTDGSFTTELSAGFVHYKNDAGEFTEINRNFVPSSIQGYDFEVTKGLYHAYFESDLSQPNTVAFETKGGAGMTAKLWGVAYLDISTKDYHVLQQTQPTTAIVNGQEIYYQNAFTNVDVKFIYTDTKLKEEIYLTQAARNNLPDPASFGLNPTSTYLVFITKLNIDLPTTSPFADGSNIRNIVYEGNHRIEFKDMRGQVKFFFPVDIAFLESERDELSSENMTKIRRRLITRNGNRFLLSGVPLSWVNNLPSGTVVFDPQITIEAPNHDVWIEYNRTSNYNGYDQLRIGRQTSYGWKRSLVKFDISTIPQGVTIQSADLKLYFYGTGGTRITRTIQCHQVLKDWTESGATWYNTGFGSWGIAGVGLDGIDAKSTPEDWQDWYDEIGWKVYNITNLTQEWVDGTATNYGVVFWATNESQYNNKDEKRCRSSEYIDATKHPKLVVTYEDASAKTAAPASITYYIRDAAGNVIGTYKKVIE